MKKVYLVGAGPGDLELITVKGMALIKKADVIVYDNLANPMLLAYKKASCDCIYVGKKSSDHTYTQDEINQMLVDLTEKYDCIVRLKGGDPYVFGRGSEEGEILEKANIDFEVVPGITSAIGGLCYAGIPITSRNVATSFHVITGHLSNKSEPIDFDHLAKLKGTLVFLMGVKNLPNISEALLKHGKDGKTPAAIIYKASTPEQRVYTSTLDDIADLAIRENVKAPSLIVVGDVIKHRDALAFFEKRPLFGQHVMVTRSRQNHSKLTNQLLELGAQVTLLPGIKMMDLNQDELVHSINQINTFKGLVFTSGVAVERFFSTLETMEKDIRCLSHVKIAVVGSETKKLLKKYGLFADIVPEQNCNEALLEVLKKTFDKHDKLLLPRSKKGDKSFVDGLNEFTHVHEIHTYDTVKNDEIVPLNGDVDYVTFTSSSTVHGFKHQCQLNEALSKHVKNSKMISIGPKTSETLTMYGYDIAAQADHYTIQGVIDKILDDVRKDK